MQQAARNRAAESGAIIEYLVDRYDSGRLKPADYSAEVRAGLCENYPRLANFLASICALPAYRRALERGGPFDLAAIGKR